MDNTHGRSQIDQSYIGTTEPQYQQIPTIGITSRNQQSQQQYVGEPFNSYYNGLGNNSFGQIQGYNQQNRVTEPRMNNTQSNFVLYPNNQQNRVVEPRMDNTYRSFPNTNRGFQPDYNVRKPPHYDGKQSFHDFLVQFELIADLNRWNFDVMAQELVACLRDSAVAVLSDLQFHQRRDYGVLVAALIARLEPDNQTQLHRAQLKSRLRKSNEPLPELAQDIRKLVRIANPQLPGELRENIAKDYFIDALNDCEIELALFQGQCQTLNDALRIAVEFEAFRGSRNRKTQLFSTRSCTVDDNHHLQPTYYNTSQQDLSDSSADNIESDVNEIHEMLDFINC